VLADKALAAHIMGDLQAGGRQAGEFCGHLFQRSQSVQVAAGNAQNLDPLEAAQGLEQCREIRQPFCPPAQFGQHLLA